MRDSADLHLVRDSVILRFAYEILRNCGIEGGFCVFALCEGGFCGIVESRVDSTDFGF